MFRTMIFFALLMCLAFSAAPLWCTQALIASHSDSARVARLQPHSRLSTEPLLSLPAAAAGKYRLPETISGWHGTILPVLSPNGKRLYFDRKWHPDNTGGSNDFDDIWFADKLPNARPWGEFTAPVNLGAPLNTRGSDVLCSLSPDYALALVYGHYDTLTTGVKYPGFSIVRRQAVLRRNSANEPPVWGTPQPITIEKYSNRAKKYYAHLAPDNRTLLLGLEREDSRGGLDLYVSFRRDTSLVWTEPLHLGDRINTPMYEGSPFLAPDGKTLYFSSEGHPGLGAADIFVSRRLDDSWQHWSEPVNLGAEINSLEEDSSVNLLLNGAGMYYVSSDQVRGKGIYYTTLPDSVQPQPALILTGNVYLKQPPASLRTSSLSSPFSTSSPSTASSTASHTTAQQQQSLPITVTAYRVHAPSSEQRTSSGTSQQHRSRGISLAALSQVTYPAARYALALPAGATYLIRASVASQSTMPSYASQTHILRASSEQRFDERTHDFTLSRTSFPRTVATIHFAQDSAELLPNSHVEIAPVALLLDELSAEQRSAAQFTIVGHTCDIGPAADNSILSHKRAASVAAALEQMGIAASAMKIIGKGESSPLVRSKTPEARQTNRRVDVILSMPYRTAP